MRNHRLISLLALVLLTSALTIAQTDSLFLEWAKRPSLPAIPFSQDEIMDMAVDPEGNILVTGKSQGSGTESDFLTIKYTSDGTLLWSARYDGPYQGYDVANALAVGDDGSVYVTGTSVGDTTFPDIATVKYNSAGTLQWVKRHDGPLHGIDGGVDVAVDQQGSAYVTGFQTTDQWNLYDFVTIKYGASGIEEWANVYDGPAGLVDEPIGVGLDDKGNVFVAGKSVSSGSEFNHNSDFTVIQYDNQGNEGWVFRYNTLETEHSAPVGMVVAPSGSVYVTGTVQPESGQSITYTDILTVSVSSEGVLQWAQLFEESAEPDRSQSIFDCATHIGMGPAGDLFVSGTISASGGGTVDSLVTMKYSMSGDLQWVGYLDDNSVSGMLVGGLSVAADGSVVLAGITGVANAWPERGEAIVVCEYGPDGSFVWEQTYSSSNGFVAARSVVSGNNAVYIGGFDGPEGSEDFLVLRYTEGAELGQIFASGTGVTPGFVRAAEVDGAGNVAVASVAIGVDGNKDWSVMMLSPDGETLWSKSYNGPAGGSDQPYKLLLDESGNVYVCGKSEDENWFSDYVTIKYDPQGAELWVARHDSTSSDQPYAMALGSNGSVYVAGNNSLLKYDIAGNLEWHRPSNGLMTALVVDDSGYVYTTGFAIEGESQLTKYNSAGDVQWTVPFVGNSLAIDDDGSIYVVQYYSTKKLDPSGNELWTASYGGDKIIIHKSLMNDSEHIYLSATDWVHCLNPDGQLHWTRSPFHFSAINSDIEVDYSGNLFMTAADWSDDWGSYELSIQTVKYNVDGVLQWKMRYQGDPEFSEQRAKAIGLSDAGEVYAIGEVIGSDYTSQPVILKYGDELTTTVAPGTATPSEFRLYQNYPNPFNPETVFRFQISDFSQVSLTLFDILGREVATIVNEKLNPGTYTRRWHAAGLSSGVYFYRLQAGGFSETRKLMVLR